MSFVFLLETEWIIWVEPVMHSLLWCLHGCTLYSMYVCKQLVGDLAWDASELLDLKGPIRDRNRSRLGFTAQTSHLTLLSHNQHNCVEKVWAFCVSSLNETSHNKFKSSCSTCCTHRGLALFYLRYDRTVAVCYNVNYDTLKYQHLPLSIKQQILHN